MREEAGRAEEVLRVAARINAKVPALHLVFISC
jgi:hypothetical protein